jgi:hypothetical protein
MPWARFDDRFHSNRKVRRAWKASPSSVGLFAMAITYSAGEMLDGFVPEEFVEQQFRRDRDERAAVDALLDASLWERREGGFFIPAFLEFNESRQQVEARRAQDAERKARGRREQSRRRSANRPDGHAADGGGTPGGVPVQSSGPDPTRPDPSVSTDVETDNNAVVVVPPPAAVRPEVDQACDTLAAVAMHVHDRSSVQALADQHPEVDIAEAAIRCAGWLRSGTRRVKHPLQALRPFVEADDAPRKTGHTPAEFSQYDQSTQQGDAA